MKEFNKSIRNDGSEAFRQCVMDYCLKTKEMPIQISKEDVEDLINDNSISVIFERGCSLDEMTDRLPSNSERFSECILKMVYLKYNPDNRPTIEEIQDRNGLIELFDNSENPIWGLAADDSVEIKMEMMIAYCPKVSDYDIIKIKNFKEFKCYLHLCKDWCISDSEAIFNVYMEDGKNTLYLLRRKDIETIAREEDLEFPKDDYGMSLIAVIVSDKGKVLSTTSRWNALSETDQLLTENELRQLLGPDFAKLK